MSDRNLNARNFGLRSRDIDKAAQNALKERGSAYGSIGSLSEKFRQFSKWVKKEHGIRDLLWIEKRHVIEYADYLAGRIDDDDLAIKTAHSYLSAVNVVLEQARKDSTCWVSPARHLPPRSEIATTSRAPSAEDIEVARPVLAAAKLGEQLTVVLDAGHLLGTRFQEAAKADYKKWLKEAERHGEITFRFGTKGGRPRKLRIRSPEQMELLRRGAQAQGSGRSLIPESLSYKQFRNQAYTAIAKTTLNGWHGLRHRYAQQRYIADMKCLPPVLAGKKHGVAHHRYLAEELGVTLKMAKDADRCVRLRIAEELGHGRVEISNSYLG